MKKILILSFISIISTLFIACSSSSFETHAPNLAEHQNGNAKTTKSTTISDNIEVVDTIEDSCAEMFLELHFSNGEIYKTQITDIAVPKCNYSNTDNHLYNFYTNVSSLRQYFGNRSYVLSDACALLSNGKFYNFSEAASIDINEINNTVILKMWRNVPYEKELECFIKQ